MIFSQSLIHVNEKWVLVYFLAHATDALDDELILKRGLWQQLFLLSLIFSTY